MDDDFGMDEKLGVQEVELDDLPVDEEVKQQVQFGEVGSFLTAQIVITFYYNLEYDTLKKNYSFMNRKLKLVCLCNSVDQCTTVKLHSIPIPQRN